MNYLFNERQRFTQWWLWLILIATTTFVGFIIVKELIAVPNNIGLWIGVFVLVLIIMGFCFCVLETRINEKGIQVRFFPFHFSFITYPWEKLATVEVRHYSPLGEYGGWGLRFSSAGKAYNVSGNIGIQLTFKDGKKLLIGTNKKEEVENTLKQLNQI